MTHTWGGGVPTGDFDERLGSHHTDNFIGLGAEEVGDRGDGSREGGDNSSGTGQAQRAEGGAQAEPPGRAVIDENNIAVAQRSGQAATAVELLELFETLSGSDGLARNLAGMDREAPHSGFINDADVAGGDRGNNEFPVIPGSDFLHGQDVKIGLQGIGNLAGDGHSAGRERHDHGSGHRIPRPDFFGKASTGFDSVSEQRHKRNLVR